LVANDQQGEATTILNDLLSARVLDSLQSHKQEIAKTLFAPSADTLAESTEELDEKKNWIAGAIKRPGALHTALHVPQGEKIPAGKLEAAAHKKGKVGQEARLAKTLKGLHEEIVQEEHESVEDFLKRGGKIKQVASHAAHGAQKKQKIKVPFRMGKAAR
jgi:hypothetical protein